MSSPGGLPGVVLLPVSAEVLEMLGLQQILQYEAKIGTLGTPPVGNQLPLFLNATSQYELLRLIYSQNVNMGNNIIADFINKHPLAIELQRLLFTRKPGILPFLMSITLDRDHPLKSLDEYHTVVQLINHDYPKTTDTEESVVNWSTALEGGVHRFMDCSLICASFAIDLASLNIVEPKLLPRLNPGMFNLEHTISPQLLNALQAIYQLFRPIATPIRMLGNIQIHGVLTPEQDALIVEMVNTYMFFLARKITIMSNIVLNPQFTVGLVNLTKKINEMPPAYIAFKYDGDKTKNVALNGIDFNEIVPWVCVNAECHQTGVCDHLSNKSEQMFVRVASVEIGAPPEGAKRTVNFDAMKTAWEQKAMSQTTGPSVVLDPMQRPSKRKYRKKRSILVDNRMEWEKKYLYHVVREFNKKTQEDDRMMMAHLVVKQEPTTEEGSMAVPQLAYNYCLNIRPKLFLSGPHKPLELN